MSSKEYRLYQLLKRWQPASKVPTAKQLFPGKDLLPLFQFLYKKTKKLYEHLPRRKTGEKAFTHPTNVTLLLKEVGIKDGITLCSGIIHDLIEEEVDLYKKQRRIKEHKEGIKLLDKYEEEMFKQLEKEIIAVCRKHKIDIIKAKKIIKISKLLTRHKRDFYYRSICNILQCKDKEIKHKALLVKLADRTHNILTIKCFNEQERIYQCFKNLFILNNVKSYMIKKGPEKVENSPLSYLFSRCAKSTYDAFLTICHMAYHKRIGETKTILQLAFKKFALEKSGAKMVTGFNKEAHPMRLFGGIIRKYDYRLHHQWKLFDKVKESEIRYCKKFFADFKFTPSQIQAILDYKDAYALKEAIAFLLYVPKYVISGFLHSDLFKEEMKR